MSDVKEGLERTRLDLVAAVFFNHLGPSQEIDDLLRIANENVLENATFFRRDPSALQRRPAEPSRAVAQGRSAP
jgi:hypothetical protein